MPMINLLDQRTNLKSAQCQRTLCNHSNLNRCPIWFKILLSVVKLLKRKLLSVNNKVQWLL